MLLQAEDWDLVKFGTYQLKELDRRIASTAAGEGRLAQCGVRSLLTVIRLRGSHVAVEKVAGLMDKTGGATSMAALRAAP